jgi:hypothetical protein
MRFITDVSQVYRMAGLEHECPVTFSATSFPPYEYNLKIPKAVGKRLIESFEGVTLYPGRDFLNDDGGFAIILDSKKDLSDSRFGLPDLNVAEAVRLINTENKERWASVLFITNNETGIEYVFNIDLLNEEQLVQLLHMHQED